MGCIFVISPEESVCTNTISSAQASKTCQLQQWSVCEHCSQELAIELAFLCIGHDLPSLCCEDTASASSLMPIQLFASPCSFSSKSG